MSHRPIWPRSSPYAMADAPSRGVHAPRTPAKSITPPRTATAGPPRMTTSAASTTCATYSRPSPAGPSPKTHTDPATSTGHHRSGTGTPSNPNLLDPSSNPGLVPGNLKGTTSHRSNVANLMDGPPDSVVRLHGWPIGCRYIVVLRCLLLLRNQRAQHRCLVSASINAPPPHRGTIVQGQADINGRVRADLVDLLDELLR